MNSYLILEKAPLTAGLFLSSLLLVGCGGMGPNARIKQKSEVFATLAPQDQSAIKEGALDRGYSPEMVYMALGEPTKKEQIATEKGVIEAWTYSRYYGTYSQLLRDPRRGDYEIIAQHGSTGSVVYGNGGAPAPGPNMAPSGRNAATTGTIGDAGQQPKILTVYFIEQKVVEATLKS